MREPVILLERVVVELLHRQPRMTVLEIALRIGQPGEIVDNLLHSLQRRGKVYADRLTFIRCNWVRTNPRVWSAR